MRWQGRRQSDNVEDQRGEGGGFPGGIGRGGGFRLPGGSGFRTFRGGGFSGILILAAIFLFLKFCTNTGKGSLRFGRAIPMDIMVDVLLA